MGGFGAMNIAIHQPDIFGTVVSLGGYYRADRGIWGAMPTISNRTSPIEVLPNDQAAWKLHIRLGAGTQDEPYNSDTEEFAHLFDSLSIPYHLDLEKGGHSWDVWAAQLYNALLLDNMEVSFDRNNREEHATRIFTLWLGYWQHLCMDILQILAGKCYFLSLAEHGKCETLISPDYPARLYIEKEN
jgi:hypothetical protein